jgi:alpha-D-ribose 1-methylphosphonate 5-triphosphate diphosphatase
MDHTPGQGQFREVASFKNYYGRVYKKSDEELNNIIDRKLTAKERAKSDIEHVVELCKSLHIPLASHDDDSEEKIRWLDEMQIMISEFPVTMEALRAAQAHDIHVCLGSPNVLRGNSQAKNLSARNAIAAGFGDILCSDYSPMTMLHAVFALHELGILPLHQAVNMASVNPAIAVGISEQTGSLEENKIADIIVVDMSHEVPKIVKTFVAGREVYSAC